MHAIIEDRGRQYLVNDGLSLLVDFVEGAEPGSEIRFDRVLALGDAVGAPVVPGAVVTARVEEQVKARKIFVTKFHRRKDYRRRQGHRQRYTRLTITGITS